MFKNFLLITADEVKHNYIYEDKVIEIEVINDDF